MGLAVLCWAIYGDWCLREVLNTIKAWLKGQLNKKKETINGYWRPYMTRGPDKVNTAGVKIWAVENSPKQEWCHYRRPGTFFNTLMFLRIVEMISSTVGAGCLRAAREKCAWTLNVGRDRRAHSLTNRSAVCCLILWLTCHSDSIKLNLEQANSCLLGKLDGMYG